MNSGDGEADLHASEGVATPVTAEPSPEPKTRGVLVRNNDKRRKVFLGKGKVLRPGQEARVSKKVWERIKGVDWLERVDDE